MPFCPSYLKSFENGYLDEIIADLTARLAACSICPRSCKVDRLKNEAGFCKTGFLPKVYSYMSHQGEEPPISGSKGSGTVFFSNCNMGCIYCQNYEFSQLGQGREVSLGDLAGFMLRLQDLGCHNINLVTPTHVLPQILAALKEAIINGLNIPIVYNTGGYELPEIIRLLEGIVDIYLVDMRYADNDMSLKYSSAAGYPHYNQESLKEMRRQIKRDEINSDGIMHRGLIIRHLVLPEHISGTEKIMRFIREELSEEALISLMSQYLPYYKAEQDGQVCRRLKVSEYEEAKEIMDKYGLHKGWIQDSFGLERFAGVNIKSLLKND
ncbi:MAG: radical SAM protein [Candidatus Omnitrophica bacterium]|nr:radical SAM protein [Candidatus Omnitrophota bacterium]